MFKWFIAILKQYFLNLFPFVVVFLANLYNPSDSDLGWHLKYGEYFFRHGSILRENIFSTMMPGYRWVNSSWATDLLTYSIFRPFGFVGLAILGAFVVTLTFFFFARAFKLSFFERSFIFIVTTFYIAPLTAVSFRGQLLSLLFMAILYYLLSRFAQGDTRFLFFTIPLFLLWSNFHGAFVMGLGIFLVWIVGYWLLSFRRKKLKDRKLLQRLKLLFSCLAASSLVTLINPFGVGVLAEAVRHFGNPWQKFIVEWLPLEPYSDLWWQLVVWGGVLLLCMIVIIGRGKIRHLLPYLIVACLFFALAWWMRRYAWPMYLLSIPLVQQLVATFTPKKETIQIAIGISILIVYYLFIVLFKNPLGSVLAMNWDIYCKYYVGCSQESAEFLIKNKPAGEILTFYNWGGWLIWRHPQLKPSIDGRMHLWEDHGYSAFAEYYPLEQNWQDIDKSRYTIVYMTPKKPLYTRLVQLIEEGKWQILYRDDFAGIFVRANTPNKKATR